MLAGALRDDNRDELSWSRRSTVLGTYNPSSLQKRRDSHELSLKQRAKLQQRISYSSIVEIEVIDYGCTKAKLSDAC